jgi:tRNA (cmo5U34)-methyltransferase
MAQASHTSGHDHRHDWTSADYVTRWAEGQDEKEEDRREPFRLMAESLAYEKGIPITFLDVGAGYGALTLFLLEWFPSAAAVCQDGSEEMIRLGRHRMAPYEGRFTYVQSDFSARGWSRDLGGPFDAVVSAIAIHNVRDSKIIQAIYEEIFALVKGGGCFLNFERTRPALEDQMAWLRQAGFADVRFFWNDEHRAVFGGFKGA